MNSEVATRSWHHTLWAMAAVQFIMSSAFSIVPPVLPLLLPGMGIHDAPAVRMWAGTILGVTPLAAGLMSPFWGALSDRIDRRLIILISCMSVALCTALMSFASHPWQLLGLRFSMGLFGGHIAAGMALVGAVAPNKRMGAALGWLATSQLSGSLLGPLIGGALADFFHSLHAPFFGASFGTLLVAGAILLVPKPRRIAVPFDHPGAYATSAFAQWRKHSTLIVALFLTQCAVLGPQPIISLFVKQLVGARPDIATLAGFAFSIVALSGIIGSPVLGRLSDTLGARPVLLVGLLTASVCALPQAFAPRYDAFVAARFFGGLFLAGIIPTLNAMIGRSVPEHERGRIYGITTSATFFGGFAGPVCGGALAAELGLRSVFLGSACLLLTTAIWVGFRFKRTVTD